MNTDDIAAWIAVCSLLGMVVIAAKEIFLGGKGDDV